MGRKVRSDKKESVQPFISIELRDCIYRLSDITDVPVKDILETIIKDAISNKKVMDHVSQNFRRDLRINNTIYMGNINRVSIKKSQVHGKKERVSTRVSGATHEQLKALHYALDCSVAMATALLLDANVKITDIVNRIVEQHLNENVDVETMKELRKIMKYIRANNPYDEDISWSALLSYMVDEVKTHVEKVQDTVTSFVINRWDKP